MSKKNRPERKSEGSRLIKVESRIAKRELKARQTRNAVVSALALGALGGGVWLARDAIFGKGQPTIAALASDSRGSKAMPGSFPSESPDQGGWMNRLSLPEVGPITEGGVDWMTRLPKGVDRARLSHFDAQCRSLFDGASKRLSVEKDVISREKIIFDFIAGLIQQYRVATENGVPENFEIGSERYVIQMQKINSVLLPFGDYIYDAYGPTDRMRITFFHNNRQAEVRMGGEKMPIAYVAKGQSLLSVPDSQMAYFNAELNQQSGIAVLSEEGAEREFEEMVARHRIRCEREGISPRSIDLRRAKKDTVVFPAYHEAAHSYLNRKMPYDFHKTDGLRKRGDVTMGHYRLPYAVYALANNAKLHELFANGVGLMESGASAVFTAHAISSSNQMENYKLAREVLWQELMNSQDLNSYFRIGLRGEIERTQSVDFNKMAVAIDRLSDESLHKIGERMAKLALYLSEE